MAAKYTDAQRDAALDAVDALIESGSSVNAALKQVGAEHEISPGTIRSWRARHGRSQPVGDRNASVAAAQAAIVSRVDGELTAHLDAAGATRRRAVELLDDQPGTAAKLLSAANATWGTMWDKAVKLGRIEGAERTKSEVEVSLSPEQVKTMTDAEIAALLGE